MLEGAGCRWRDQRYSAMQIHAFVWVLERFCIARLARLGVRAVGNGGQWRMWPTRGTDERETRQGQSILALANLRPQLYCSDISTGGTWPA